MSFNWPYISLQNNIKGFLWLINLNSQGIINRIQVPQEINEIIKTEITDNFELYILCETGLGYKLYMCDLDVYMNQQVQKLNKFKVELVLEFTREQIPIDAEESI